MKTTIIAATLACAKLTALAAEYEAWGHTFTCDEFKPYTVEATVATETATGHTMVLVPAARYVALMLSPPDQDDMLR